jgi:oxygen-independent coproporphyrinogen-3 oxidase
LSLSPQLESSIAAEYSGEPLGLYLHAPFCRARCSYCSFASCTDILLEPLYISRLLGDIAQMGRLLKRPKLETLYWGGGTPSVLSLESLNAVSRAIHGEFDASDLAEATIEANPGTLNPAWLYAARSCGWDRISLGVQSLDDDQLTRLGRIHNSAQGLEAIATCKNAGFTRISADLLLGAPGQPPGRALDDARRLVKAGTEHLSIYMLDLDKECPLKSQVENGSIELPDEGLVADAYLALSESLPNLGLAHYEISNFAFPGRESAHNCRYWLKLPYLGLGPSAASNIGNIRWIEDESPTEWIKGQTEHEVSILSPKESLAEIGMLGLRMNQGINWKELRRRASALELADLVDDWETELEPIFGRGLLQRDGESLRLTTKGMLLSNQVLMVFA